MINQIQIHYMRRLILFSFGLLSTVIPNATIAQKKTQSIIYDAASVMNAKYGLNALLIPTSSDPFILDPLTGKAIDTSDATQLKNMSGNTSLSRDIVLSILKRNAGLPDQANESDVKTAYSANPFLKTFLDELSIHAVDSLRIVSRHLFGANSGGLGGNIFGNLVNGSADFLIKRAQEEISISVFQKLKDFISRYPEFDILFPNTCALIKPVNAYEYNKALDAFKAAIHEDLKNLIPRISLLYDIPRYKLLNERVPSLTLVFSATSLIGELHDKSGFAATLYKLGQQSFLNEQNNYANFLKVLILLSNSLLDKKLSDPENKEPQYIQVEFIKLVTHNDPVLWRDLSQIYLGLIWQHTYTLNFTAAGITKNFGQLLEHWAGSAIISKALETVDIALNAIAKVDNELGVIKREEIDDARITGKLEISIKRFTIYASLVSSLLSISELYINPANVSFTNRISEIRKYFPEFTSDITMMVKEFQQEEYNLGLSKLAETLESVSDYLEQAKKDRSLTNTLSAELSSDLSAQKKILEDEKSKLNDRVKKLPKPVTGEVLLNANIEAEKQELIAKIEDIDAKLDQIAYQEQKKKTVIFSLAKVIEYVNLLAAITKAENSAAVESLLETYALPAGSSRIKKVSSFNIAVNAYVGGFFGRSTKDNPAEGFTNTYGFTAPIGFTISTGFHKMGSLSVFAGVFDIGATIQYKLDNQGKYQQDISFAGIISPGVHIVYGFPFFLPLSAGAGYQWVSPTTSESNKIDLKPGFNAFIAVDIPLFNLTRSPNRNKP